MFEQKEYHDEVFSDLKVVEIDNSGKLFEDCGFKNCNFENVAFKNANMVNCTFSSCSIILPEVTNLTLDDVTFDDCKIVGFNFSTINNFNTSMKFIRSKLMTCSFISIDIRDTSFSECMIDDTVFRDSMLKNSNFEEVQFRFTSFVSNDLTKANFKNASGFQIDPCNNKLKGASFSALSALELVKYFDIKLV